MAASSVALHQLLGQAAKLRGNKARGRSELRLGRRCSRWIAGTGDGSHGHPYLVTTVSDELHTKEIERGEVVAQRSLERRGCILDRLTLATGREVFFELPPGRSVRRLAS